MGKNQQNDTKLPLDFFTILVINHNFIFFRKDTGTQFPCSLYLFILMQRLRIIQTCILYVLCPSREW